MNLLVSNITEFVEVLRLSGLRVSLAETIDAVQALEYTNILDKNEVKVALAACLAKSEDDRKIYYSAFDKFFVLFDEKKENCKEIASRIEQKKAEIIEQVSELRFQGEQIEIENDLKEVYANLEQEEKQSIRDFLDKTSSGKNVKPEFKSIVENIVKGKLDKVRKKAPVDKSILQSIFQEIPSEAGLIAGQVIESLKQEKELLYKNIGEISEEDVPAAVNLIKNLVERLKKDLSRKYKKSGRKAGLDLKKTIRSSLSTGGVQFNLKYKSRSKRRDRLLILCDVSASMYRFSGFVLQFLCGMNRGINQTDSYIFSEQAEHLNIQNYSNPANFEQKIKESKVWRKGTNIGNVLSDILFNRNLQIGSSTIIIMVSDAKTVDVEKTLSNLNLLKSKSKRIIWLNPTGEKEWQRTQGINKIREYCTMFDCSTIEKLADTCRLL